MVNFPKDPLNYVGGHTHHHGYGVCINPSNAIKLRLPDFCTNKYEDNGNLIYYTYLYINQRGDFSFYDYIVPIMFDNILEMMKDIGLKESSELAYKLLYDVKKCYYDGSIRIQDIDHYNTIKYLINLNIKYHKYDDKLYKDDNDDYFSGFESKLNIICNPKQILITESLSEYDKNYHGLDNTVKCLLDYGIDLAAFDDLDCAKSNTANIIKQIMKNPKYTIMIDFKGESSLDRYCKYVHNMYIDHTSNLDLSIQLLYDIYDTFDILQNKINESKIKKLEEVEYVKIDNENENSFMKKLWNWLI